MCLYVRFEESIIEIIEVSPFWRAAYFNTFLFTFLKCINYIWPYCNITIMRAMQQIAQPKRNYLCRFSHSFDLIIVYNELSPLLSMWTCYQSHLLWFYFALHCPTIEFHPYTPSLAPPEHAFHISLRSSQTPIYFRCLPKR